VLASLGVRYDGIIEGVGSPRILINDEIAVAINHPRDEPLDLHALRSPLESQQRTELVARVFNALSGIAWIAWKYGESGDADDYVQTMLVAKSLTAYGGFDHCDLVARYRSPTNYRIGTDVLGPSGIHPNYKGQVSKLLQSNDPFYQASDGVSDGAAMKISPAAAFYVHDFCSLVENTDRITQITHATVEARLAALLVALRLRQVLLGVDPDNMNRIVDDLAEASKLLKFGDQASFFMDRVDRARMIALQYQSPKELLYQLCRRVGMDHLAWSTPVSACFWSFHRDADYGKWLRHRKEKWLFLPRNRWGISRTIHAGTLARSVQEDNVRHLREIGQYDEFVQSHGYHWGRSIDIDTFFSIAISILAARHGLDMVSDEVSQAADCFGDDLMALAERLVPLSFGGRNYPDPVLKRIGVEEREELKNERLPESVGVSVVVATLDRPVDLANCLRHLIAQETARTVEIIVADNNPGSGQTPLVVEEFPGVCLVKEARRGLSYARNAGVIASRGEIIVITDDDVTMPKDWLEKLLAPFVRNDVMIVTGNVLPLEGELPAQRQLSLYRGWRLGFVRKEVSRDWFDSFRFGPVPAWDLGVTANAAFRASIFTDTEIGLFPEELGAGSPSGCGDEETYLFYRTLKRGHTIVYNPAAWVWYNHRTDMSELRRKIYNYSKGNVAYNLFTLVKDRDLRGLAWVVVGLPVSKTRRVVKRLLGRSSYPLGMIFLEIAGDLAGPFALMRSHFRVKREGRTNVRQCHGQLRD